MSKIRKVKMLEGMAKDAARMQNLKSDDLVIVKLDSSIEKVEGDAVSYLLERAKETGKVQTGSDIISKSDDLEVAETEWGDGIVKKNIFLKQSLLNAVVVPKDTWTKIQSLIERHPSNLFLSNEIMKRLSEWIEWFEELRKYVLS